MLKVISSIIIGAFDYFKTGLEIKKAEKENRARLLRDKESNNHEWEMASLSEKDKSLRRICFFIFIWPITPIAAIRPDWIVSYYSSLENIPEWNLRIIMIMVGGIWGVAELKNSLPALIHGIKNKK